MSGSGLQPSVDVRRAQDRFQTTAAGIDSRHSFSFGHHYDPGNTHHGVLLVHDDHLVQPGRGFASHRHRDLEIVTWVLTGSLIHQDTASDAAVVQPGVVQRLTAGAGVLHSERNADSDVADAAREPLHFVQMWVVPDEPGTEPSYEQRDVAAHLLAGGLVLVASGRPRDEGAAAIRIANRDAALHIARLAPGQSIELPDAPHLHLFVARGGVAIEEVGDLDTGDAVRFTATGGHRISAVEAAEVLVWEMHRDIAP